MKFAEWLNENVPPVAQFARLAPTPTSTEIKPPLSKIYKQRVAQVVAPRMQQLETMRMINPNRPDMQKHSQLIDDMKQRWINFLRAVNELPEETYNVNSFHANLINVVNQAKISLLPDSKLVTDFLKTPPQDLLQAQQEIENLLRSGSASRRQKVQSMLQQGMVIEAIKRSM